VVSSELLIVRVSFVPSPLLFCFFFAFFVFLRKKSMGVLMFLSFLISYFVWGTTFYFYRYIASFLFIHLHIYFFCRYSWRARLLPPFLSANINPG